MNNLEGFLARLELELDRIGDRERADEVMRELRAHLEQCVAELQHEGHPQPEEEAVRRFGDRERFVQEMAEAQSNGLCRWDRTTLGLALSIVGLVVLSDVGMDALSYLTGGDMRMVGVLYPVGIIATWFVYASVRSRRILWKQLGVLVGAGFLFSTLIGGLTQGVDVAGSTMARGTAYRRMLGDLFETPSRLRSEIRQLQRGAPLFAGAEPADLGEFKTSDGQYLAPVLYLDSGTRYYDGSVQMQPFADYASAATQWRSSASEGVRELNLAIDGYREESKEFRYAAFSPWWQSVLIQNHVKTEIAAGGYLLLLSFQTLGFGVGALLRRRQSAARQATL